jgi:P-type Na+/K+ transporter
LYIPVINTATFKHRGISWGIVFAETTLFFAGLEGWEWGKRIFFRRTAGRNGDLKGDLETKTVEVVSGRL